MGKKRTKFENKSSEDFLKMKGITQREIHDTSVNYDIGYPGVGKIINHAENKVHIVFGVNLPNVLYHYQQGTFKDNYWYGKLCTELIDDVRRLGVKNFEFVLISEYVREENLSPKTLAAKIKKYAEGVAIKENAYYTIKWLKLDSKKKTSRRKKSNKNVTHSDIEKGKTAPCTENIIDFSMLKSLNLEEEQIDSPVRINIKGSEDNLEGRVDTLYTGGKFYDTNLKEWKIDDFYVGVECEGKQEMIKFDQVVDWIRKQRWMSAGVLKVFRNKLVKDKLYKYFKIMTEDDGFSTEEIQAVLSEFKGDYYDKK